MFVILFIPSSPFLSQRTWKPRRIPLARKGIWQICFLAVFSFGQPLTWMKTNVTEAKHTSGNMSLAFQLRINMPKDKCNTLPLKYWTPLLWSQRQTWNDWYFILHQSARFHSHSRCFDVILTPKENMQHTSCFLIDCWE